MMSEWLRSLSEPSRAVSLLCGAFTCPIAHWPRAERRRPSITLFRGYPRAKTSARDTPARAPTRELSLTERSPFGQTGGGKRRGPREYSRRPSHARALSACRGVKVADGCYKRSHVRSLAQSLDGFGRSLGGRRASRQYRA